MTTPLIERIYQKYISVFYEIDNGAIWIDLAAVRYALRAALREMADAQPGADIVEEHRYLDATVRQIERVVEAHDSAVYADLVAGNIALPTAIDGLIASYKAALAVGNAPLQRMHDRLLAQIIRINDWCAEHAPDEYHSDGDTADAIIAVADKLRGQVARLQAMYAAADAAAYAAAEESTRLRHDLETAIAERDDSDGLLAKLADWLIQHGGVEGIDGTDGDEVDLAIILLESQATEIDALRQQIAQMDADNARLTEELRTVRSWSVAPTGNGKSHPAAILPSAQSADETPAWNDAMLTGLDDATADYWHGIAAGRWTWRKLPKSVRLAMVRHVLSFGPEARAMSMSEFDAIKPHWMPGAGSHPITFSVPWSTLSDMRVEIEVPA